MRASATIEKELKRFNGEKQIKDAMRKGIEFENWYGFTPEVFEKEIADEDKRSKPAPKPGPKGGN